MHQEKSAPQTDAADRSAGQKSGPRWVNTFRSVGHGMYIPHRNGVGETFIQTKCMSTKIFALANGHPTPATNIAMLEHRVREPERTVNMVPDLENQYLLRGGKFAKAGYVSV